MAKNITQLHSLDTYVGQAIQQQRLKMKWDLEQLSNKLREKGYVLSAKTLNDIENGLIRPETKILLKLSDLFNVNLAFFFTDYHTAHRNHSSQHDIFPDTREQISQAINNFSCHLKHGDLARKALTRLNERLFDTLCIYETYVLSVEKRNHALELENHRLKERLAH